MRRIIYLIAFILAPYVCFSQNYERFVRYYIATYKSATFFKKDTSLIYIPSVVNLSSSRRGPRIMYPHMWFHPSYNRLGVEDQREHLFDCLMPPKLAFSYALDLKENIYYEFRVISYGKLNRVFDKKKAIWATKNGEGPNGLYNTRMSLLFDYLREHPVEYIFQIQNIWPKGEGSLYWIINDKKLYALIEDEHNQLITIEAKEYISDIAPDWTFDMAWDPIVKEIIEEYMSRGLYELKQWK